MAPQASSSSSSIAYGWTYDVFLSFRGEDTRHGFTGHLYNALRHRGIHTFIDDKELPRGHEITPALLEAIKKSMIAIIVLSKDYASSSFCLDELATVMECIKGKGRLVLPIFYDVDPSDVRHQRGTYGEALARLEERFKDDKEKVPKWRETLHQAANLSGEHFKVGKEYEHDFVEKIVKEICKEISRVPLHVAEYPVGLEFRVLKVNKLLNDGSDGGVHMVGIYGIGGKGKTTLARAVYNSIANQFEGSCFLENVREDSIKYGLKYLQEMILSKILREKDIKLASVSEGISVIKQRFQSKKLLLVLDDVDKHEQLQAVAGLSNWFGFGSRVIITTRDEHLLTTHGVERKYEMEDLNKKEALQLLGWHAFKSEIVDPSYMDILNKVVSYASGLPLALVVIGSNLFGRSVEEWTAALDEYKKTSKKGIHDVLKVSYDALDKNHQEFFLDIACCFKGYKLEEVECILHANHDVNPKFGIRVLVDRSLIKIDNRGSVTLHDLIQDMGRKIVCEKSPEKPGERSRLWLPEDIMQVLQENTGTSEIEIIIPEAPLSPEVVEWDEMAFKKMNNLKTLIIRDGNFYKGPKYLPNSLRVLEWWGYPSHSLPADFHPRKLTILNLPNNCFSLLQLGKSLKKFSNIRVLNFNSNKWIKQIPDVSSAQNLEELHFTYCENLIKVDQSVGFLGKLRILDVSGSQKLRSLPSLELPSLERLSLARCFCLKSFPEILGKMEKLTKLDLGVTQINELPYSICNITGLQSFSVLLNQFLQFPSSIFMLSKLNSLAFRGCSCLLLLPNQDEGVKQLSSVLPSTTAHLSGIFLPRATTRYLFDEFLQIFLPWFSNLRELDLSCSNFAILPACIKDFHFLETLDLSVCKNLQEIRGIPPNIKRLDAFGCTSMSCSSRSVLLDKKLHEEDFEEKEFTLPGTRIPDWFEHQSSGQSISFWFRNKIPTISLCFFFKEEFVYEAPCFVMGLNINDVDYSPYRELHSSRGHLHIYDFKDFAIDWDELEDLGVDFIKEHAWNQAVICLEKFGPELSLKDQASIQIGVHIIKERSSADEIRFTNPLLQKEEHRSVDMKDSHNHRMQQQQTNSVSLELQVGQGTEPLLCLPPPPLNDNLNCGSNSKLISSSTTITVQDQRATEMATGESSHAPDCAETQYIQAPSPTSLSCKASEEELHLKSSCTASSTSIDNYLRTKNEISDDDDDDGDDDDAEMDAFYAPFDAGIPTVSHSHDKLATAAPSAEARKALKSVQRFISYNDASVLLHFGWCIDVKASLDYLSNLSADDGISREIRELMSEASQLLTQWSRDYIEASMKIDSITSMFQKADELEMSLEGNTKKFKEVVATKANMSVPYSEKSITRKRKREIFEEGKALKAELDELRKNVPQWEHEHVLAKRIQAKIKAEWSKLREKFNKMVEKWNLYELDHIEF